MHSTEERALRHKKSKCKGPVARRSLAHVSERHVTGTVATERAAPGEPGQVARLGHTKPYKLH